MIKITDLKIPLEYDLKVLEDIVAKRLHIEPGRIENIDIAKSSVNSKDKQNVYFNMTIHVSVSGDEDEVIARNRNKSISKELKSFYT
jgi:hypothetical protein